MKKILIIDDDINTLKLLGYFLKAKYELKTYLAPKHVLDANGYDVILLDYNFPGENGLDFIRRIRGEGIETPVIMISAVRDYVALEAAFELGVKGFLTKPLSRDAIIEALENIENKINYNNVLDTIERAYLE